MDTPRIRRIVSDEGRGQVQTFFEQNIDARWRPLAVTPFRGDDPNDVDVAAIREGGRVIAAAHWSRDYESSASLPAASGQRIIEFDSSVRMLHNVAVDPENRREGLGRRMVQYVEEQVRAQGFKYLIGVAAGTAQFFEGLGFVVLPEDTMLKISLPSGPIALPLNGSELHWFIKEL